jgi:TetR/AcrR family transcriptional regulator, transcriptional repressor for nem operon
MKISKEKALENRLALIEAAGRLFREHGIDGVGVAEISKAAGLTHGALYAHFASKEALAAAALAHVAQSNIAFMETLTPPQAPSLTGFLDYYVSPEARDNLSEGCALAASASEIARQDEVVSASFADGFTGQVKLVEAALRAQGKMDDAHTLALTMVASMIGTVAVARALSKSKPALSDELLASARAVFGELGGENGSR